MRGGRYLVAVAAAGMLAAGCGTTVAGTQPPGAMLAAAVTKTGAQSARIAVTIGFQAQGMSMSYSITGAFDFAHSRGMLTMAAPVGLTELFVSPKVYLKFSGSNGMTLPHGKTWMEIDTSALPPGGANPLGPLGATSNPADLLGALTSIAGSVRNLGAGTVRGVPVTEYQVNIDPAKAASKLPAADRASFRQGLQSLGKATIPVDVWVDSQNLVRRFRLSLNLQGDAGALGMSGKPQLSVTIDFYDFGAPVQVSAPPASQVASMSRMISSGTASASGSAVGFSSVSEPASAIPVPPAPAPSASAG